MSFLLSGTRGDATSNGVVLQYFGTEFEELSNVWPDDTGTQDMDISGGPIETALSDSSQAVGFDGVDDVGETTAPPNLEGASLQSFSVEFAFQTTSEATDQPTLTGSNNDTDDQSLLVQINRDEGFSFESGNFIFRLQDAAGSSVRCSPSANPNINDGTRHDLSIIINDASANDVEIVLDGSNLDLAFGATESPSNFGTWEQPIATSAFQFAGSLQQYLECDIGAIRWHDEAIQEQTISDYE